MLIISDMRERGLKIQTNIWKFINPLEIFFTKILSYELRVFMKITEIERVYV